MELKFYLGVLVKKWWLVIPVFLITLTATVALTFTQQPTYQASTTMIVAPSPSFGDVKSFASGLNILSTRQEIASTYAEIGASRLMKNQAADILGLEKESRKLYKVSGQMQAGTNIIAMTVEGPDPATVTNLANQIGVELTTYAAGLYETFVLRSLDQATMPVAPIRPNKALNIVMAAVLGLGLAVGLAFLSEYLQTPVESGVSINFIDNETGIYNKLYFLKRLGEEMIRAKRNRYPLAVALMRIDDLKMLRGAQSAKIKSEVLRQISVLTSQYLRDEDIVARFDQDTFAFLLPDVTGDNAKAIMEYLQTRIAWTPFESSTNGIKLNLTGTVGIVAYDHNGTGRDELIAKAGQALELAEVDEAKTHLVAGHISPSNSDE